MIKTKTMYVKTKIQHHSYYLLKVDHEAALSDRFCYHEENIIHLSQYGCHRLDVTMKP